MSESQSSSIMWQYVRRHVKKSIEEPSRKETSSNIPSMYSMSKEAIPKYPKAQ